MTWKGRRILRRRERQKQRYIDRLTGDRVTLSERLSLGVQAIMRRWLFVAAYTAVTVLWWTHPQWFGDHPGSDARWQDWASYMALLIESVVGIGMFSWARRDSVVIRKIHALERQARHQEENSHLILHDIYRLTQIELEQIRMLVEMKRNGNGNGHVDSGHGPGIVPGGHSSDHRPDLEHPDPPGGPNA